MINANILVRIDTMAPQGLSKYNMLVDWVRQRIDSGDFLPGEKLYSENELSRMFGISRQTVRQAIGILENEKLVERRRGSGTYIRPTPEPPHEPTKTIGVVTTYLDDYIFPSIIRGIEHILSQNGYTMRLSITHNKVENETVALTNMLQDKVDGLIVEPTKSALPNLNRDLYAKLAARHIPCLMINGCYPDMDFPCVAPDDMGGGREAARHLLLHGHKKIGGIFKSDDIQGHLRYEGFARALRENGMTLSDDVVLWYVTEDIPRLFDGDSDAYILSRIKNCTAVVCYNDEIAVKVIEILRRAGVKVPEDISIISFDNSNLATSYGIGITSIAHPKEQLGEVAAQGILAMLNDRSLKAGKLFEPVVVERQSVLKLNG